MLPIYKSIICNVNIGTRTTNQGLNIYTYPSNVDVNSMIGWSVIPYSNIFITPLPWTLLANLNLLQRPLHAISVNYLGVDFIFIVYYSNCTGTSPNFVFTVTIYCYTYCLESNNIYPRGVNINSSPNFQYVINNKSKIALQLLKYTEDKIIFFHGNGFVIFNISFNWNDFVIFSNNWKNITLTKITNIDINIPNNIDVTKLKDLVECDSDTWICSFINTTNNECLIVVSKDYNDVYTSKIITTSNIVTLFNDTFTDILYNPQQDYFMKMYTYNSPITIKIWSFSNISNTNVWYGLTSVSSAALTTNTVYLPNQNIQNSIYFKITDKEYYFNLCGWLW